MQIFKVKEIIINFTNLATQYKYIKYIEKAISYKDMKKKIFLLN